MKKLLFAAVMMLTACAPKQEAPPEKPLDFSACNEIQEQFTKLKPEEVSKEVGEAVDKCKQLGHWAEAPAHVEAELKSAIPPKVEVKKEEKKK